jgi:hypothetical protein
VVLGLVLRGRGADRAPLGDDDDPATSLGFFDTPTKLQSSLENGSLSGSVSQTNTVIPGYGPSIDYAVQQVQAPDTRNEGAARPVKVCDGDGNWHFEIRW